MEFQIMNMFFVFLACFKAIAGYDHQAILNATRELHEILNSPSYYSMDRPVSNWTKDGNTDVKMQISILAIGPIDSKEYTFRIDYFMRLWWKDERLKFSKGTVTYTGNPKGLFWIPDLYVMNSREVKAHSLAETYRTTVQSDGSVYWSARISEICACEMDLHNFPMDEQKCKMVFESYAYNAKELTMNWNKNPVEILRGHLTVHDFQIKNIKTGKQDVKYIVGDHFEHLEISFRIRRTVSNYISRIYLPSAALVLMTWGTFWLPKSTYPARIAIIVTNFLASILLLRGSDDYTKVPYMTAIDIFFIVNIIFIVASIIEYMITLHHGKIRNLRLLNGKVKRDNTVELKALQEKQENGKPRKELTPLTDKISRYLFPLTYLFFLIVYFSYFLSMYESE